jgi:hypothetical protein
MASVLLIFFCHTPTRGREKERETCTVACELWQMMTCVLLYTCNLDTSIAYRCDAPTHDPVFFFFFFLGPICATVRLSSFCVYFETYLCVCELVMLVTRVTVIYIYICVCVCWCLAHL